MGLPMVFRRGAKAKKEKTEKEALSSQLGAFCGLVVIAKSDGYSGKF
jgi:hypothetical protein